LKLWGAKLQMTGSLGGHFIFFPFFKKFFNLKLRVFLEFYKKIRYKDYFITFNV
jgi:uncharacterized membrane protein YdjX (TVP38/TMEM64 family)